jgi:hypothetical protein
VAKQKGEITNVRISPEIFDLVDQTGAYIGPADSRSAYDAEIDRLAAYHPEVSSKSGRRAVFLADRTFREYHLENCPGCFPEEQQPLTYLIKVRPNGIVTRSLNPAAQSPRYNIHPEPDELIKFPAELFDLLGLDGSWRQYPFPEIKKIRVRNPETGTWYDPGTTDEVEARMDFATKFPNLGVEPEVEVWQDADEIDFWDEHRAVMAAFVEENPWWNSTYFRLRSVAADTDFLAHHFATCEGTCQPWRGNDLHPPFSHALQRARRTPHS